MTDIETAIAKVREWATKHAAAEDDLPMPPSDLIESRKGYKVAAADVLCLLQSLASRPRADAPTQCSCESMEGPAFCPLHGEPLYRRAPSASELSAVEKWHRFRSWLDFPDKALRDCGEAHAAVIGKVDTLQAPSPFDKPVSAPSASAPSRCESCGAAPTSGTSCPACNPASAPRTEQDARCTTPAQAEPTKWTRTRLYNVIAALAMADADIQQQYDASDMIEAAFDLLAHAAPLPSPPDAPQKENA